MDETAGPNSRFRKQLINMLKNVKNIMIFQLVPKLDKPCNIGHMF